MLEFLSFCWPDTKVRRRRPSIAPFALQMGCEALESRQVLSAVSVGAAVAGHEIESDSAARNVFRLREPIDARAILIQCRAGDGSDGTAAELKTIKLPEGMVIHGIILQNGLADPPPEIVQRPNGIFMLNRPVLAVGLIVSYEVEGQEQGTPPKLEVFRFPSPARLRGIIPCVVPGDVRQA